MKLTKDMKRTLVDALIERKFAKQDAVLKAEEHEIAEALYELLYPAADRQRMYELPDGWLNCASRINAVFVAIDGEKDYHRFRFADAKRVLAGDQYPTVRLEAGCGVPQLRKEQLFGRIIQYVARREAHYKARQQLRDKVSDQIYGIGTRARLLEMWPAAKAVIERVIPERAPPATPNLPALIPSELNVELELP